MGRLLSLGSALGTALVGRLLSLGSALVVSRRPLGALGTALVGSCYHWVVSAEMGRCYASVKLQEVC